MEKVVINKQVQMFARSCDIFITQITIQESCIIQGLSIGFLEILKGQKIAIVDCIIDQITISVKCVVERCKIINLFTKNTCDVCIRENSF